MLLEIGIDIWYDVRVNDHGQCSRYMHRLVDPLISELLGELSAIAVIGPRASGKTTTALRHASSVIRVDRPAEAYAVAADPDEAISGLPEPILLDEWQEAPEVLGAVKRACDAEPRPGRFIMTGSVRAETQTRTWPGTGRVTYVTMLPLTVGEQLGAQVPPLIDRIARSALEGTTLETLRNTAQNAVKGSEAVSDGMGVGAADGEAVDRDAVDGAAAGEAADGEASTLVGLGGLDRRRRERVGLRYCISMALKGGFPQSVITASERVRRNWLSSYAKEIVARDAATAGGARDRVRLRRYFQAYALNSAGVTDDSTIYRAAGIDRRTALAYHELLDRIHVIADLPAWTSNRLKRLSSAPKRFLIDSSLLAAVTGAGERTAMRDGNLLGRLLETFVVSQLRAQAAVSNHQCDLYHLRQHNGRHEIDVIAELDAQYLIGIEIKAAASPTSADARHLAWLRDQLGTQRFLAGIVLHTGPAAFPLGDFLWALPISTLWH